MGIVFPVAAALAVLSAAPQQQPAPASQPQTAPVRATAVSTDRAPVIDGRDADDVWRRAPRYSEFRQFEPKVDADPSFRTEFAVAYDERNLYVFARMFDPHPDSIMRALSRRDVREASDQVKILIDSYHDKRSGFEFAVNPVGVKRDFSMSNDGNEDASWNGIWDVATLVDSLGWTAEFRIPLSQLRYASGANTFGFGVWRDIERYRERVSWPLWHPQRNGLSSQLGELTNLAGMSTERHVELTPYAVTKNVQRLTPTSSYERLQQASIGGDVKVGLTPNITLDATVNPDFGQVEADPSVVNLTAFETFFSERRPFFVEGTGLYQFQLNCYIVVDCSTNEGLFYSRRIGRSPTLRNLYGDASTPTATTIAAATKLTGRLRNGLSFGLLDAVTPAVDGLNDQTAEPFTNYAVLRANQDLRGGNTGISLIATGVNRSLDQWTEGFMHRDAYTAGATFRNRFSNRRFEVAGQFAASRVTGTPEAMQRTQQSPVHYFQQPGDDLGVDPDKTAMDGYAAQLKFGKYGGGVTRFETSVVRHSAGFEANDLGFLRRADLMDWSTWGALSFRDARGIYRWAQINGNHWETWNTSGTRLQNAFNVNGHMGLRNNWDVHLGGTMDRLTESYCDRCTRGGPALRGSRGFYPWGGVNTDSRKVVSGGMWVNLWYTDEGNSQGRSLDPYINLRVSSQLQAGIGAGFSNDVNDSQWFGNFTDGGGVTHYTFARLDQRTSSMNVRVNYTVTPDLTVELYAQPFVSSGTYSDIRELSATPEAASYAARFQPYAPPPGEDMAFKVTALNSNSVLRWEYRPGSTLFVVWQHGREGSSNTALRQTWSREYREIFDLHPDNTFLVKLAYWLSR
ncbi:MAG TPA: DUF5916 domain-containing protein [Gemmatimonadaceae bacterium]|nr:DUF5916 domain-containing protein [Gemmatimonadaceae bacterium]